jgi:hypothetical protein
MRSAIHLFPCSPLEGEPNRSFNDLVGGYSPRHLFLVQSTLHHPPTKIAKGDFDSPSRGELGSLYHHSLFTTHGTL